MLRLDDIYYNMNVSDDEIIGRVLNMIVNDNVTDHATIANNALQFVTCFAMRERIYSRPKIKKIINDVFEICDMPKKSVERFNIIVEKIMIAKNDMENYANIYLATFCRAIWENEYEDKIYYKDPKYAVEIASGAEPFMVFLSSLESKDYVLI